MLSISFIHSKLEIFNLCEEYTTHQKKKKKKKKLNKTKTKTKTEQKTKTKQSKNYKQIQTGRLNPETNRNRIILLPARQPHIYLKFQCTIRHNVYIFFILALIYKSQISPQGNIVFYSPKRPQFWGQFGNFEASCQGVETITCLFGF